ncbi:interferon-induced protein 44-like [Tachysurus vachellii]|uniref:interferon-induced protein 44-like n=1 Tax=Tachysurus vachellii TaxID=175792 RepID=UPI00296AC582|nr:interferon-induced protein 44-like [Tachysurus vachellii]XP_060716270.1 interferon-induced protein 44-like [Tachysurus vachellii]XP_060716271.1 interferon-induced protein 44-like [Tachysurus vachellii]
MGSSNSTPTRPPPSRELSRPWRETDWSEKDELLHYVNEFKPSCEVLRIMLYGPVGAGKSSFINSVQRVILGRNAMSALENSSRQGSSFTKNFTIHKLKKGRGEHYPLEIVDIMGIEPLEGGIKCDDIINALEGHILDEYTFNPVKAISNVDPKYNKDPTLSDKVHCLVCVLPADSVSRMEDDNFAKMKRVRAHASLLEIPQVIVMTQVDKACELVNQDLKKIYYSRKIKEKAAECSNNVGVSLNAIYPLKNYPESIMQEPDTDVLILTALRDILNFANDYVEREMKKEKS